MQDREAYLARKRVAARKWWNANREQARAAKQKRFAALPPEKIKAHSAKTLANYRKIINEDSPRGHAARERRRAYAKRWNADNHARHLANLSAWKAANPERTKEALHRVMRKRRAAKKGAALGVVDYMSIPLRTGGCCGICGEQVGPEFHYDHIVPLSRGGPHITENIQLAHPSCNARKGAKLAA